MADMNNMNKEYRLERMNNYAGTAVNERTYNLGRPDQHRDGHIFYLPDPVS